MQILQLWFTVYYYYYYYNLQRKQTSNSEFSQTLDRLKLKVFFIFNFDYYYENRGGSRRVAKFLSESNTSHIKSKAIKMLSCKNFATHLDPPLENEKNN